jgi:hypothetical protein
LRIKRNKTLEYAWCLGTRPPVKPHQWRGSAALRKSNSRFLATMRRLLVRAVHNERNLHVSLHINDLIDMWHRQKGRCALTGIPMSHTQSHSVKDAHMRNVSLDRIDPSLGYVPDNLQLVCLVANMMKWQHSNDGFVYWCRQVTRKADGLPPLDEQEYLDQRSLELDGNTFI